MEVSSEEFRWSDLRRPGESVVYDHWQFDHDEAGDRDLLTHLPTRCEFHVYAVEEPGDAEGFDLGARLVAVADGAPVPTPDIIERVGWMAIGWHLVFRSGAMDARGRRALRPGSDD